MQMVDFFSFDTYATNYMSQRDQLIVGILLVLGINLSAVLIALSKPYEAQIIYLWFMWLIGLIQFLYVIPLILVLVWRRQWELMKGVMIGAGVTVLLNVGGCWLQPALLKFF